MSSVEAPPKPFVRADGFEKVTGLAQYTADLSLPGMVQARFLYSGSPRASIERIDTRVARSLAGVLAVLTQDDMPSMRYGPLVKDRTLLAKDVVRFDGEVVAAVAATTEAIAEHACSLIEVDYQVLEAVLDPEVALGQGVPLVHEPWEDYDALTGVVRDRNDAGYANIVKGDVDAGLAQADVVVEERYVADMSHAVPIEPHAVVAHWLGPRLTVWSSTQMPFVVRAALAEVLQMPERDIRVIVPHLGGGFGGKCEFHFEAHVALLARKTGRPVRLVLSRREEFTATDMVRHPVVTEVATGLRRDGTMLARRARLVLDTGAYAAHGPVCSDIATMMAAGPYRIPNLSIEAHAVYTNKTPAGSVRAPTGPQVCWAIEQHTDVCAQRLGMDPIEFRLRNLVDEADEGPTGQTLAAVGAQECLTKAAELIGWGQALPEDEGLGVSCGWWFSMAAPSGAFLRLNTDGSATVITGAQENGSGGVMGLALLVSEELGIAPDQVSFVYQDTDTGPYDVGSGGSQTTFNNGRALVAAAEQVREQLRELATNELETAGEDLVFAEGAVHVRGAPNKAVSVAALAQRAMDGGQLILGSAAPAPPPMPESFGSSCAGRVMFPAFQAPTFFCHAARVRVDHETGVVRVLDLAAAHDFGLVINPGGASGQVEGGAVHAVGMALTEGTRFGEGRQRNPHLLDYKLQTAADAPPIKLAFVERPAADGGPRGLKGVGEPPVVPTAGAIANAIAAATNARVRQLPMTPERVWAALHESEQV